MEATSLCLALSTLRGSHLQHRQLPYAPSCWCAGSRSSNETAATVALSLRARATGHTICA